jgi:cytosine/adenosine deaminase-related metal-dependent hydrolase
MTETLLIRARWIVTGAADNDPVLDDSGLRIESGRIAELGAWADLHARFPDATALGGADCAIMPGLINAHHHSSGASVQQQGLNDDFLEPWIHAHAQLRSADVDLNTLLSAARMLRSGVTSVVDVHSGSGNAASYDGRVAAGLDAYRQSGMRVAFAAGTSTRSHLVHGDEDADGRFLASLPGALADRVRRHLLPGTDRLDENDYFAIIEEAWQRHRDDALIDVWFGPPGPQWVGDRCLLRVVERAAAIDTGIQTHLVESYYEKLMGPRLFGTTPLRHLHGLGILSPRFSIAHGVWLDEPEIALLAESGASVSHNPSSNLRLRAGIAPLNAFLAAKATVGLGMDGTTLNDDDDMFAEMRLALRLNRGPVFGEPAPTPRDVLALATTGGARLLRKEEKLGRLRPGYEADLVILDLERILAPWTAPECDPVDLILLRARPSDVRSVLVAGHLVYDNGCILGFDEAAVARELAERMASRPFPADAARTAKELAPYIEAHYRSWNDPGRTPFTAYNARS